MATTDARLTIYVIKEAFEEIYLLGRTELSTRLVGNMARYWHNAQVVPGIWTIGVEWITIAHVLYADGLRAHLAYNPSTFGRGSIVQGDIEALRKQISSTLGIGIHELTSFKGITFSPEVTVSQLQA